MEDLKYQQKVIVEKGDVLMGKAASTGKIAQVKTNLKFIQIPSKISKKFSLKLVRISHYFFRRKLVRNSEKSMKNYRNFYQN